LKAIAALLLSLLSCQGALADHRKPTTGEVAAIVQAVEDEIYDWGYENGYTGIGNTGAITSPTDVAIFITPDLDDEDSGSVVYKFMPFGEVLRRFGFRPDGLAVLWGNPWNEFPASQPDTKTIYLDDDDICAFKQRALRATFTVDPDVSRARREEAARRQVIRLGSSQLLERRRERESREKLGLEPPAKVFVSLPALHVGVGERIVGFHLDVTSGRIAELPDVPPGWNISVNNHASWNTSVDASTTVTSAAALDIEFFRDFIAIEKDANARNSFEIKGEVTVSKDLANVRKIPLGTKDFVMAAHP
jgi:hypothetical protein